MADLSDLSSAQTIKVAGADSSGLETYFVNADSNGQILAKNPSEGLINVSRPTSSTLIGGSDGTNLIPILVDAEGRLVTSALTGFGADFAFGDIVSTSTTLKKVNRTVYTEQTTNAQRSIASSSANDTSSGTGARTLQIIYYDEVGDGPFSEIVTLNGTTFVNTVNNNICFIEEIIGLTAGSAGQNAGILTLKASSNGGGATIGTINVGDNRTFWCHHYVALGKVCNITGISAGHSSTVVGGGGVFTMRYKKIGVTGAIDLQVSDFVRAYGQSSTFSRVYQSPIKVSGPAKLQLFVTPETGSSTTYRGSIDFFEP